MSLPCANCNSPHGPLGWFNNKPISICSYCKDKPNIFVNILVHYNTCAYMNCKTLVNKCECDNPNAPHDKSYCTMCELNMGYHFK